MNESLPRAILLDFYGTVVEEDDVPIGEICDQVSKVSPLPVTAAEVGSYWSRVFAQLCSPSFGAAFQLQRELERLSLQHVLQHFKADLDADALSQVLYDYWAHPTIFPESKEVLARCRIPVCLVSNIDNAELQSALAHNNLHFQWVLSSEDCKAYKPRQEVFEKALSTVGMSAPEVLHVGDSFNNDVCGAKNLGIPVLWVNRKKKALPGGDFAPDYVSADLTGLSSILEKRNTRLPGRNANK